VISTAAIWFGRSKTLKCGHAFLYFNATSAYNPNTGGWNKPVISWWRGPSGKV
jgi:hypothetical protein